MSADAISRFLHYSRHSLIAQPAIHASHFSLVRPQTCSYRYTDYVEIMAALIDTCALQHILKYVLRQDAYSDWGIDMLWCKYSSYTIDIPSSRVCMIVDSAVGVKHRSTKRSYSYAKALNDKRCIVRHMKRFKTQFATHQCLKTSGGGHPA